MSGCWREGCGEGVANFPGHLTEPGDRPVHLQVDGGGEGEEEEGGGDEVGEDVVVE